MLQLPPPLFGGFVGTTGQSDSLLRSSMALVLGLPIAARRHPPRAVAGSPGSRAKCFQACSGSSTAPGPAAPRHCGASGVAFGSGNVLGTWELNSISRLNTRPACAPVNASGTPSQACPHDSGSSRVASPSMCDFLLRYTLPVYPGASSGTSTWSGLGWKCPARALTVRKSRTLFVSPGHHTWLGRVVA